MTDINKLLTLAISFLTTMALAQKHTMNGFQNGKKADRPLKEIHYLPRNYTGKVAVIFNQPKGKVIEYAGDYRIYRIPECGILKTNFLEPQKIVYSSKYEDVLFVYFDKNGKITDTIPFLPYFEDMDSISYNDFMAKSRNKVFVIEWGYGGFSIGEEHYHNVESYIIDTLKNKKNYRYLNFTKQDFEKCKNEQR